MLIMKGQYKNNLKIGKWVWYHINGNKKKQELYENTVLKKVTDWNETGYKMREVERDGILNQGDCIVWYDNGVKYQHFTYDGNKLDGRWREWHTNGQKRADGEMKYGSMNGRWTFWYHNGQKELECEFAIGNPLVYRGSRGVKIYHDNGTLKEVVTL